MENEKKKESTFVLYPSGNYLYPYDREENYMILISFKRIPFFWTDRYVLFTKDHTRHINKWLLPAYILWS